MVDWWPSQRVPQGGIMHPAKVQQYSPETHKMLKEMMQESKLTMQQRNKMNYFLRNGEPLPTRSKSVQRKSNLGQPKIVFTDSVSKLRSRSTIINSGAYERDKFVRNAPFPNREEAKTKLQEIMEFGKARLEKKVLAKHRSLTNMEKPDKILQKTRFEQLKEDIAERLEWLEEMEQLGQGKKYQRIINQQVAEKLREIENLDASGQ